MKLFVNMGGFFDGSIGEACVQHGQVIGLLLPAALSKTFPNLVEYKTGVVKGVLDISTGKRYKTFYDKNSEFSFKPSFAKGCGRQGAKWDDTIWDGWDGFVLVGGGLNKIFEVEIVEKI